MAVGSQKVLVWWCLVMAVIYVIALRFLLHMFPPPTAKWSSQQVAQFYAEHSTEIKVGAAIGGWTGAFWLPFVVVLTVQMYRHERGKPPVWTLLACVSGPLMSVFLVLCPLFWGVAAFTPGRSPEVTTLMHELGVLSFVTTDQYVIFIWVALAVICLTPNTIADSPFPRWFGYFTAWTALMFEGGAVAFLTRSGPFAWNGLLAFWSPIVLFSIWFAMAATLLNKALNRQAVEETCEGAPPSKATAPAT